MTSVWIWSVVIAIVSVSLSGSEDGKQRQIYRFKHLKNANKTVTSNSAYYSIDMMKEDRFEPGVFYYSVNSTLRKFSTATGGDELVLGQPNQPRSLAEGNSSQAAFSIIIDIVQYNETRLIVSDILHRCIREYDFESGNVSTLVGACSPEDDQNSTSVDLEQMEVLDPKTATQNIINYPISLALSDKQGYMYIADYASEVIFRYNFSSTKIVLVKKDIPELNSILLSPDETALYVNHGSAVSVMDVADLSMTALVGARSLVPMLRGSPASDDTMVPGPFSNAIIGLLDSLQWLISGRVIVGYTLNAIITLDIVNERVDNFCTGKPSVSNLTVTGDKTECNLVDVSAMAVSHTTEDIYVSTDKLDNVTNTKVATLYALITNVPQCELPLSLFNSINVTLNQSDPYYVSDKVEVDITCAAGKALNSSNSEPLVCVSKMVDGSLEAEWNRPVPICVEIPSEGAIQDITPLSGQRAGGTVVTISGLLPDVGLNITLLGNSVYKSVEESLERMGTKLMFTMPSISTWESTNGKKIDIIIQLTGEITEKFTYSFLPNPSLETKSSQEYLSIPSGGINLNLNVANINSASNYTLSISTGNSSISQLCGVVSPNTVTCKTPELEAGIYQKTENLKMNLQSEGITMLAEGASQNLELKIQPNPVFYNDTGINFTDQVISFTGDHLDIGVLKDSIEITIAQRTDNSSLNFTCEPTSFSLYSMECEVLEPKLLNASPRDIHVQVGYFSFSAEKVEYTKSNQADPPKPPELYWLTPVMAVAATILAVFVFMVQVGYFSFSAENVEYTKSNHYDPPEPQELYWLIPVMAVAAAILAVFVYSIMSYIRATKAKREKDAELEMEQRRCAAAKTYIDELRECLEGERLLIPVGRLTYDEIDMVGSGQFGKIYRGLLKSEEGNSQTVAIKRLIKEDPSETEVKLFLEEALLTRHVKHDNILPILGIFMSSRSHCSPLIALPFMEYGDLKSLLIKPYMKFTVGDLLHFSMQIADGMEQLHKHDIIHRDLAARNCLVDRTFLVKISDFGLSRDVYSKDYYRLDRSKDSSLPVKWLALESLQQGHLFNSATDVWSYGVLLWELFTRGSSPYSDIHHWDMREYLLSGKRLDKPKQAPHTVYQFMSACWQTQPDQRPTFTEILEFLRTLLEIDENVDCGDKTYERSVTKPVPLQSVDTATEVLSLQSADTAAYLLTVQSIDIHTDVLTQHTSDTSIDSAIESNLTGSSVSLTTPM